MTTLNTSVRSESPLLDFGPFGRRPKGWEGKGEAPLLFRALLLIGSALTLIA